VRGGAFDFEDTNQASISLCLFDYTALCFIQYLWWLVDQLVVFLSD